MNHALVDAARMTTHLERCIQDLESTEPTQVTAMLSVSSRHDDHLVRHNHLTLAGRI